MTIETDNEVSITIKFDEAVQAIAYLSDLLEFLEKQNLDKAEKSRQGISGQPKRYVKRSYANIFRKN